MSKLNPAKYNPRKNLKPGDVEYEKIKSELSKLEDKKQDLKVRRDSYSLKI